MFAWCFVQLRDIVGLLTLRSLVRDRKVVLDANLKFLKDENYALNKKKRIVGTYIPKPTSILKPFTRGLRSTLIEDHKSEHIFLNSFTS